MTASSREFPVISRRSDAPASVPWSMLAPHEQRAAINHGQSLERLAQRGGLAPGEIFALVHDLPWSCAPSPDGAIAWLHAQLEARKAIQGLIDEALEDAKHEALDESSRYMHGVYASRIQQLLDPPEETSAG